MELIEYKEMREAIVRVRELHKQSSQAVFDWLPYCEHCSDGEDGHFVIYPCDTIKALDGEQ